MTLPIPAPDPMPLPAPVWLLKSLLLLTFFLHMLFMNCAVGGGVMALAAAVRGEKDKACARLARKLAGILPVLMAFTITLGVAALLFVQVLYGQMLYVSSILLGVGWMSVIPLLIIGYYGFYWANLKASLRGLLLGVIISLLIGFIYVNNMSLMLTPERWLSMYAANAAGLHLNLDDATLLPRYLHMMLGAVAVGGLFIVILGLREKVADNRRWMLHHGATWFTAATVANFIPGFWFLVELRPDVRMVFMGGSKLASALLLMGILLPIGAIVHLQLTHKSERHAYAGIGATLLTIIAMIGMRDIVRTGYLSPVFRPADLAVSSQWGVIAIFLVLFVAGLATLAWMIWKVAIPESMEAKTSAAGD